MKCGRFLLLTLARKASHEGTFPGYDCSCVCSSRDAPTTGYRCRGTPRSFVRTIPPPGVAGCVLDVLDTSLYAGAQARGNHHTGDSSQLFLVKKTLGRIAARVVSGLSYVDAGQLEVQLVHARLL